MAPPSSIQQPLFLNTNLSGFQSHGMENSKEDTETMIDNSGGGSESSKLTMELRHKISTFRDIIELPAYDNSCLIHLAIRTIVDLHKLYPNMIRFNLSSETHKDSVIQGLVHLYAALKSVGTLWGLNNSEDKAQENLQNIHFDQIVGKLLAKLTCIITTAKEMFDVMDEDESLMENCSTVEKTLREIYSRNKVTSPYPDASTSPPTVSALTLKLEEWPNVSSFQAIGNLKQINTFPHISAQGSSFMDETRETVSQLNPKNQLAEEEPTKVSFEEPKDHFITKNNIVPTIPKQESNSVPEARDSGEFLPPPPAREPPTIIPTLFSPSSVKLEKETATPPLPPIPPSVGSEALPPAPPIALAKGAAPPPPPPLNLTKIVRLKRAATKLKRSTQMSNLYRILKGKVEGSSLKAGTHRWRKTKIGGSPKGKEGLADALTEITKRSAYFKQIEEDVLKHGQLILELKAAINSFQTTDMDELIKFHKYVEQNLEKLTDETQVLPRFEGFPVKKLESLRAAAVLYSKLKGILIDLQNWKVGPPLEQLINKVESYFNKIKGELDALERSKDEDSKKFQSNNIHFDFGILLQIKESLVDVSSSCMELALKEERETTANASEENGHKKESQRKACIRMLWRAFQLAFRVYSFAGGQDDRADRLSMEVAHEIEIDAQ